MGIFNIFKKKTKDGECIWYYENGKKFKQENYKDGILHGETIGYHQNGEIGKVGEHKNGKKDGDFIYYNEDGSLNRKCVLMLVKVFFFQIIFNLV